jgi:hypothetical protein
MSNRGKRWKWGDPRKKCTFEGCGKPQHGEGLCNKHYKRLKSYGDPHITVRKAGRDSGGNWQYEKVWLST